MNDQKNNKTILTIIAGFGIQYAYKFPETLLPEHHLENDLGLDSLGRLELCMKIESELTISIHDDDIDSFKTIGDIQNYLTKIGL